MTAQSLFISLLGRLRRRHRQLDHATWSCELEQRAAPIRHTESHRSIRQDQRERRTPSRRRGTIRNHVDQDVVRAIWRQSVGGTKPRHGGVPIFDGTPTQRATIEITVIGIAG